ncbi:MAG: helix-turn-helix domain-containing protein [Spirochaetes bacterium]|jgi:DNA-binding IclR family transcriptional regulator|nr:helix-turn-helix domain-containing protein [Spirochaetota bacterium]
MGENETTSYPVAGTVVTAASILEAIAARDKVLAQDLSKDLDLNRSTVHRMLRTLQILGYVAKHPDGYYRLTFHLFEIGNSVLHSYNLIDTARRSLLQLSNDTGYTVNHAVLFEDETLYVDKATPPSYLQLDRSIGETEPLHCTSLGKTLLAYQPAAEQARIVESIELVPLTQHTITDRTRLAEELERVRTRGYAVDDQELALELRCVAAPVLAEDGTLISAVSISGPADKLLRETVPTLLPRLADAVSTIGRNMADAPLRSVPGC